MPGSKAQNPANEAKKEPLSAQVTDQCWIQIEVLRSPKQYRVGKKLEIKTLTTPPEAKAAPAAPKPRAEAALKTPIVESIHASAAVKVETVATKVKPSPTAVKASPAKRKRGGSGEEEEEEEQEYEVEAILKSRKRSKKEQYLVKWKGWKHSDNTWEPEENLVSAKEI